MPPPPPCQIAIPRLTRYLNEQKTFLEFNLPVAEHQNVSRKQRRPRRGEQKEKSFIIQWVVGLARKA